MLLATVPVLRRAAQRRVSARRSPFYVRAICGLPQPTCGVTDQQLHAASQIRAGSMVV